MTIKADLKHRKIARILKNISFLKQITVYPINEFLDDYEKVLATLHAIQENIQICIDIAFYICAINKFPEPESYRQVFVILAENKVIDKKLASKLENWVGLRNIITHIYEELDYTMIFKAIQEDLSNFEHFIKAISKLQEMS